MDSQVCRCGLLPEHPVWSLLSHFTLVDSLHSRFFSAADIFDLESVGRLYRNATFTPVDYQVPDVHFCGTSNPLQLWDM